MSLGSYFPDCKYQITQVSTRIDLPDKNNLLQPTIYTMPLNEIRQSLTAGNKP